MNTFNSIHETVINDVFDTIKDGIAMKDYLTGNRSVSVRRSNSLARATSGLTLVFPVICTNTLTIEIASMLAKAIERKNVSMLQIAFSAYNITNATDAIEHLSKFHTNLDTGKLDLDKFMDMMEALGESYFDKSIINMINEDCKRNINYVLDDNINETSLLEYSQITDTMGRTKVIQEKGKSPIEIRNGTIRTQNDTIRTNNDTTRTGDNFYFNQIKANQTQTQIDNQKAASDQQHQDNVDRLTNDKEKEKTRKKEWKKNYDQKDRHHDDTMDATYDKMAQTATDQIRQYYTQQLLPSDVKKANEMQPSLLLVNFYVNDADRRLNIAQQAVAGVKSKLYPVDSADIITKIVTKHADSNVLLKLVKVATRELSFVKDFLLGLDQAKLDALSKSRRGSGNALFKALERRAIRGKIRKSLRMENSAKAISTLVISAEEAEDLKKYNDLDIMEPRNIVPIMEKLNLLYFVVVDTTAESVSIITDGENEYESYSFTSLEREAGDGAYKKVVNLMTKLG